jgi:hypothetical protein
VPHWPRHPVTHPPSWRGAVVPGRFSWPISFAVAGFGASLAHRIPLPPGGIPLRALLLRPCGRARRPSRLPTGGCAAASRISRLGGPCFVSPEVRGVRRASSPRSPPRSWAEGAGRNAFRHALHG